MNFRQKQHVSWGPFPSTDSSIMDFENGSFQYPSPPAEESSLIYNRSVSPSEKDQKRSLRAPDSPTPNQGIETAQSSLTETSPLFYPGNPEILFAPDMVLCSEDNMLFYLNSRFLATMGFKLSSQLPLQELHVANPTSPLLNGGVSKLRDSSSTLSTIFSAIYCLSYTTLLPSLDTLSYIVSRMPQYNLTPSSLIRRGTPIYIGLVCQYAPFEPLELYTFAAQYCIEALAVDVSSHLLGFDMSRITDEAAIAMGARYLKRLAFMHKGRTERLKNILAVHLSLHDAGTGECDPKKQATVRRKWICSTRSLLWDAKPDISPHMIKEHLRPAGETIKCKSCRESWMGRSNECGTEWATVKFTI